jgi:hypothetical protein
MQAGDLMLTDRLRAAVGDAAAIPTDAQDQLAARIESWLDALDDALWDQQLLTHGVTSSSPSWPLLPFPAPTGMGDPTLEDAKEPAERSE